MWPAPEPGLGKELEAERRPWMSRSAGSGAFRLIACILEQVLELLSTRILEGMEQAVLKMLTHEREWCLHRSHSKR
jgi:hypothetical protein